MTIDTAELRRIAEDVIEGQAHDALCNAADEIDRLRAENERLTQSTLYVGRITSNADLVLGPQVTA